MNRLKTFLGPYTALVVVLAMALSAGGYAGQAWVKEQIRKESAKQAAIQLEVLQTAQAADRENINRTGCAIRKIVAPQLASLEKARKDPTITKSQRARAEKTYQKTLKVLAIWTTIPPDFDCSTLKPQPAALRPGN